MALKTVFVTSMLLLAIYSQTTLGYEVKCENLDEDTCAFAVSSTGKRCVLEKSVRRSGIEVYSCRSSEIEADKVTNIIESNECIEACGLDRKSLGISSDALLESRFTQKLCSVKCLNQCPNVVDLFFNLAAGEGVFLPKLCESQEGKTRRAMSEIRSSGIVMDTLGPVGPVRLGEMASEPATSPEPMPNVPAPEPATSMGTPVRLGEMAPEPATSTEPMPNVPAPEPATSMEPMPNVQAPELPISMEPMPNVQAPEPATSMEPMPNVQAPEPATSMEPMPNVPAPEPATSMEPMPNVPAPEPATSMEPMPNVQTPEPTTSMEPMPNVVAPSPY